MSVSGKRAHFGPMDDRTVRILFVCMGNICRSPLAEGIFRELVNRDGLHEQIEIDSAGIGSWHVGELADPRTRAVAQQRGLSLTSRARQVRPDDLDEFDLLIVMDEDNLRAVERLRATLPPRAELRRLREFDSTADSDLDVPDPFYGGDDGFEVVHDMIGRACEGLLEYVRRTRL